MYNIYTMNILVILYLVGLTFVSVSGVCPNGWTRHGPTCYHFSHDTEDWPGALIMCERMGGNLVEVDGADEDKYLVSQVKVFNQAYWIGLSDVMEEGSWIWMVSKNPIESGSYSNWSPGEPDNIQSNENCAELWPSTGQWNDGQCHVPHHYICEKSDEVTDIIG
ncbi:perlucin-like protein [Mercenaria mercenaria]|uniref:perlucin-like protein n=1 Tax=Mercenaria mercenaria TaxID=6596 RepID=UPI00234F6B15|nr:perlucin-like protein [Mercenaria mercenaria]